MVTIYNGEAGYKITVKVRNGNFYTMSVYTREGADKACDAFMRHMGLLYMQLEFAWCERIEQSVTL